MSTTALALLVIAAGCAMTNWWAVAGEPSRWRYVAKPATMVVLIGAVCAFEGVDAPARWWMVAALACCLAGDVLLMVPANAFVAGLWAFLLGHLAYIVALASRGHWGPWLLAGVAIVAPLLAVVAPRVIRGVLEHDRSLVGPVVAYQVAISAMMLFASGTGLALAVLGAALFCVSDSILAWSRFVRPIEHGQLWVMVTYHLAQGGLVLSLLQTTTPT